jgi:hypothetical protein
MSNHKICRQPFQATVSNDVTLLKQAILHDRLLSAVCDLEEVWQMTEGMLVAQARFLPQYSSEIEAAQKRWKQKRKRPISALWKWDGRYFRILLRLKYAHYHHFMTKRGQKWSLTINNIDQLLQEIIDIHNQIRDSVVAATETAVLEEMAAIAHDGVGDTIYAIDKVSEEAIIALFNAKIAVHTPIILIAEGIAGGEIVLPPGASAEDAHWRVIVDPIDGTRGLMYQKRSAWILTGVAPNKGPQTNLQDIALAVQTEIPLIKQYLSDQLWVISGQPVNSVRYNRLTGETVPIMLRPSRSDSIAHGYAYISRFFPGVRQELAAIDEEIVMNALGPVQPGKSHCFEDQYICTGGQLYELMAGHDRFIADIRPVMEQLLSDRGLALGICCHPYDICTELIARTLGVIITDEHGQLIDAPLAVDGDVSWIGYANPGIEKQIKPLLQNALRARNLI